jgi:hypothetical protein
MLVDVRMEQRIMFIQEHVQVRAKVIFDFVKRMLNI